MFNPIRKPTVRRHIYPRNQDIPHVIVLSPPPPPPSPSYAPIQSLPPPPPYSLIDLIPPPPPYSSIQLPPPLPAPPVPPILSTATATTSVVTTSSITIVRRSTKRQFNDSRNEVEPQAKRGSQDFNCSWSYCPHCRINNRSSSSNTDPDEMDYIVID